jgi:gas vesicle protein
MNIENIIPFLIGIIVGVILAAIIAVNTLPNEVLRKSKEPDRIEIIKTDTSYIYSLYLNNN